MSEAMVEAKREAWCEAKIVPDLVCIECESKGTTVVAKRPGDDWGGQWCVSCGYNTECWASCMVHRESEKSKVCKHHGFLNEAQQKKLKADKLKHYASREITVFHQRDGFSRQMHNEPLPPDGDGDGMYGGTTFELMNGADVRVLIHPRARRDDVVRMLKKIVAWVEREDVCSTCDVIVTVPWDNSIPS